MVLHQWVVSTLLGCAKVAVGLFLCAGIAQGDDGLSVYADASRTWLEEKVAQTVPTGTSTPTLRMEIALGELDRRLHLAPCSRVEPHLPAGTRLWGKTRIGLRCLEGASRWNVFLPVTVRAYGPGWILKSNVSAGTALTESDALPAEVDWAEDSSPVLARPEHWIGKIASTHLVAGQALRQSQVRAAQVFEAGSQIRVVTRGTGFQITADGQALSQGVVGQSARVRMESGRILTGLVLDDRTVKVEL